MNNLQDLSEHSQDKDSPSNLTFWQRHQIPVILTTVGGAIDTIGFIGLLGFFTNHVTGNLVMAGGGLIKGGDGLWVKLGALPVFLITVMITKRIINLTSTNKPILSNLLFAEAAFLLAFLASAVYFGPFEQAGTLEVAFTGFLGLIAFTIRNTAGKTTMGKMKPTLLMTGNTTQLGIDLSDYVFDRHNCNMDSLKNSFTLVSSFTIGALVGAVLFIYIGLWAIAPFILPVLYAAIKMRDEQSLKNATGL